MAGFREREFGVSFDRAGVFGNTDDWLRTSSYLINEKRFTGVEMIGWTWSQKLMESLNKDLNIRTIGIHGRTGDSGDGLYDSIKLKVLNGLIFDVNDLIKVGYEQNVDYILLHQPVLNTEEARKLIVDSRESIKCLMIENHLHPGAIKVATDDVQKLRCKGVNAGFTCDISHSVNTEDGGYLNDPKLIWKLTMDRSQNAIRKLKEIDPTIQINLHLSLGESDCIPKEYRCQEYLKDIADILLTYPDIYIIFEGQQEFQNSFKLTSEMAKQQRYRNKEQFDLCVESGIIISELRYDPDNV